jgi:hypothetical protein
MGRTQRQPLSTTRTSAPRSICNLVRTHTPPENGASAQVFTKCWFVCVGDVVDPEDGLFRWEYRKQAV